MYRVHFEYFKSNKSNDVDPSKFPIRELIHGFWINTNLELTKASDNVYFIPPSKIIAIEKIDA